MNQLYLLSPPTPLVFLVSPLSLTRTHSTSLHWIQLDSADLSDFLSDPCVHELIGDSPFASSMDPQSFHPSLKSRPLPPPPSSLTSFPILAISIVGIITTSILLLSYYVFVIKCCLNWHRSDVVSQLSRSRRRRRAGPFMAFSNTAKGLGLDESTIQAIPTFRYREEVDSVAECAVCLNGFHEEERIKLLPDCFHVFHIDCIDTWLQANANCPLCRSSITAPIPTDHLMALVPSSDPYRRNDAVVEVRDVGSDLIGAPTTTDTSPWKTEQGLGHKKGRKLQYLSSMGDECIDLREKDEQFCVQRMRRSFSMGSSGDRQLDMALQRILQQNSHLQDVDGEISSSSGRYQRSFFSFGPSSPSAVLPLQIELRSKRNLASLLLEVF